MSSRHKGIHSMLLQELVAGQDLEEEGAQGHQVRAQLVL